MIRWYDYAVALMVADLLVTTFFTVPVFGAIIAYVLYDWGWTTYCEWRKGMEYD